MYILLAIVSSIIAGTFSYLLNIISNVKECLHIYFSGHKHMNFFIPGLWNVFMLRHMYRISSSDW